MRVLFAKAQALPTFFIYFRLYRASHLVEAGRDVEGSSAGCWSPTKSQHEAS